MSASILRFPDLAVPQRQMRSNVRSSPPQVAIQRGRGRDAGVLRFEWGRKFLGRRCSPAEVVAAFKVVNEVIRAKCKAFAATRPTQVEVCQLAQRIKDQRDLIRGIQGRCGFRHVLNLVRQNRRLRNRLVQIVNRWSLDTSILVFK
jgi:hypothetical protein